MGLVLLDKIPTPPYFECSADFYADNNTHSTVSGIAAYRSALTLHWLDKGSQQRKFAHAFGSDNTTLSKDLEGSECMDYMRPAAGKISRLMLELLKNLESDDGVIQELAQTLARTMLLVPTSKLEVEPDLAALVRTPQLMQGQPHDTLPRVLAAVWMLAADPGVTKDNGWCPIQQLTQYLDSATPVEIAVHMRAVDPILSRARFILEDFLQSVAPMSIRWKVPTMLIMSTSRTDFSKKTSLDVKKSPTHTIGPRLVSNTGTRITAQAIPVMGNYILPDDDPAYHEGMKMKILILCTVTILVIRSNEAFNNHENSKEVLIPYKHLKKVLLCLEPDDQLTKLTKSSIEDIDLRWKLIDEHPKLNIEYNTVHSCKVKIDAEIQPKRILAVVAPKPLKTSSQIPMYFFDTPFLNEDDVDEFPNGLFPLRSHWQSLKHAFSHYLTTHGYQRLVVVSDDSYYSAAFEAELIEHFKEKEFVFDVLRKPNKGGFDRAMRYIIDNKAYVIIVNIDKENAQKLADAAKKHGLLSNRYLWLVRDWPFENVKLLKFTLMISMKLSPYPILHYKAKYAHDGPNLNSVSRGLTLISNAVESVTSVTVKERIDYYYK
ncbi:uncharacterized protein LOC134654798 [Cydia amplana]|uniref:uncharacterized protein LOC134654798 n=1 Tax=Cydia amplana TaxID=1869771 RepID=UPI002FE67EE9